MLFRVLIEPFDQFRPPRLERAMREKGMRPVLYDHELFVFNGDPLEERLDSFLVDTIVIRPVKHDDRVGNAGWSFVKGTIHALLQLEQVSHRKLVYMAGIL